MTDIEIGYKGSTIASMSSSGQLTLNTAGKYCEDDITIDYTRAGITVTESLDPNGGTIVNISGSPVTSLQAKSVTPTSQSQTISADSGYDAISEVLVQGDSSLIGSNIKYGTSIFGVVGTFEGEARWETAPESWAEGLIDRTISGSVYGSMVLNIKSYAFYKCDKLIGASFPECSIINSGAFSDCYSLTNISFPNCYFISSNAFYNCSSLTIASFSKCTTIGSNAFVQCRNLTDAFFPKCISMGNNIFTRCSNLTNILFPMCLSIGQGAFQNCSKLSSVYFPECISINSSAFYQCYSLQNISFPKCTSIGSGAFYYCSSLTDIFFPKCTYIYSSAFYSCKDLTTVSFPKCNNIQSSVFTNCKKLSNVYLFTSSVPTLANNAFSSTPITNSTYLGYYGSVYVLSSMINAFKSAANWSVISDRIVGV